MNLKDLIRQHRIVVCVGSGGVGKTTTAAALALHAAIEGRRAMVLTIDPAKRLAQSLGLEELASGGQRIEDRVLEPLGVEVRGSLSAGMLDQKSAWDEFIARHAPNEEALAAILDNEFYQHLSRTFAGSTEYMAIEELCRIDESGLYDLIVLDTPPSGHALDFLEAPQKLEAFFDRSTVAWFVRPYMAAGWSVWKRTSQSLRFVLERIERATGVETLKQISDFFVAMESLFDGITERSSRVREVLKSEDAAFVLVAGPDERVLEDSEMLTERMRELGMPLKGVVMNRIRVSGTGDDGDADQDAGSIEDLLGSYGFEDAVVRWLTATYLNACVVARAEAIRRESFETGLPEHVAVVPVPELRHDVHSVEVLGELLPFLVGDEAES
jgi:anion-transporting  ArsA/GET3 family ATPase